MIPDALALFVESIFAFWVGLASGGFLKIIMIWCIIYWIFCRRCRRRRHRWAWGPGWGCGSGWGCGCPHCACECGGCAGDRVHDHGHHADHPGSSGASGASGADEGDAAEA